MGEFNFMVSYQIRRPNTGSLILLLLILYHRDQPARQPASRVFSETMELELEQTFPSGALVVPLVLIPKLSHG